jgi:hypothetical protein
VAEPSMEIAIVPDTGEIIDLNDLPAVARALGYVRDLESRVKDARLVLADAILHHSHLLGSKTLRVEGVGKFEIRGGSETTYAAEEIEQELRAAGMPEERIREIVIEQVTYTVSAVEAKRAAAANPAYAEIIERHRSVRPKRATVSVS